MKKALFGITLALATACAASSQPPSIAPDTRAETPFEMCGLTGRDARDLIEQVTTSPAYRSVGGSSRFRAYDTVGDRMQDWVITQPTEAAHPAITCRQIRAVDGQWVAVRAMHCDGSPAACSSLVAEFGEVDAALGRSLRGER